MTNISNLYSLTNYITASTSGNIVISAPSSGYALDVTGTSRFVGQVTTDAGFVATASASLINTDSSLLRFTNNYLYLQGVTAGGLWLSGSSTRTNNIAIRNSSNEITFDTNNVQRLTIASNGVVTASAGLYQSGASSSIASNRWEVYNGGSQTMLFLYNTSGAVAFNNGTNRLVIQSDGGVYINRASYLGAGYGLVLGSDNSLLQTMGMFVASNGNNNVNFFNASGTYVASISTNASTVSYGTGSDYRLKEDYRDFDGLEKVSAIKVYDFKFKSEGDRMEGVIAHELQEVIPYAVNGEKDEVNEDGSPKIQNVDYSKLVPILIKSIQELSAKVTALENK